MIFYQKNRKFIYSDTSQQIDNRFILMAQKVQSYCQFCEIHSNHTKSDSKMMTEVIGCDNEFFAFNDLHKNSAVEHVLVCPIDHIETALDIKDYSKFDRMVKFAENLLTKIATERGLPIVENMFRLGFHIPPNNSIFHVHMHCLILPITKGYFDKVVYGFMLKSVDDIISKIQKEKSRQPRL